MTDNNAAVEVMQLMLELAAPVREGALGYRSLLIAAGVTPAAADAMAVDFHRLCIANIIKGIQA